jgi:hypothetical protein
MQHGSIFYNAGCNQKVSNCNFNILDSYVVGTRNNSPPGKAGEHRRYRSTPSIYQIIIVDQLAGRRELPTKYGVSCSRSVSRRTRMLGNWQVASAPAFVVSVL